MDTIASLEGKKVLHIEDDAFFLDIMSSKLGEKGCHLISATSGELALELLLKELPDVIVLDLMLPGGVDGFAVLESIKGKSETKGIPVVILSNLDRLEDVERGMKLGAFRYLTKSSVSPSEVVKNLESALHALQLEV